MATDHTPLEPITWRPVAAIAGAAALAHLVVAGRYGWHRDELYYVTSGRHLAWGYVDQPPLTPVLARLAAAAGHGVWPLRLAVIAVQATTIAMAALVARELGGRRFAQVLAAGCIAGAAVFVGASLFFGTTPVDQLLWAVIVWAVLRALRTGQTSAWLAAGAAAGIGLEDKHTVALLLLAVLVGLGTTRREVLRRPGPWLAAAIALLLWAPNLWWDARHGWVTLDMASELAGEQGGAAGSIGQLPLLLLVLPGPVIAYLWMRGARWAWRDQREHAWLVVAAGVVVLGVVAGGGKPYYPAPLLLPLFALGAVATEQRWEPGERPRLRAVRLAAVSAVLAPLLALPYFSPAVATATRPLAPDPMETYGWPRFTAQIIDAAHAHPTATAIYVSNYGEAGALTRFGPARGLDRTVVSGHNAYGTWGPPAGTPEHVIAVGEFSRTFLLRSWATVAPIGRLHLPDGLENEETENDATIYLCSRPRGTWAQLWPQLSYLS